MGATRSGLAFGTGTHPSTALCLTWLDAHLQPGSTVIDYGCGSGVLALAAAKLGAREVDAFDIDPQALIATRDNSDANGVSALVRIHDRAPTCRHALDIVVANILAGTLIELAPQLCDHLAPGGRLILAGILKQQVHEVRAGFRTRLDLEVFAEKDGWSALSGRLAPRGLSDVHHLPRLSDESRGHRGGPAHRQGYVRCGRCERVFNALMSAGRGSGSGRTIPVSPRMARPRCRRSNSTKSPE
ncbi:MAG: 50S ribosomal protein L11 methyltransferase [Pseudomonadota bacterium]